ncbi:MAG: PilN domain-containing protein, partial [Selenomonadaceae bacterium]
LELQQLKNEKKVQLLTALSSRRASSARGILIHLGFLTTDNIKLTGLEFQADGMLRLDGRAADYDALAAYLHRFETDDFFAQVHLAGAESEHDATGDLLPVTFSLQSSFGGQEAKE